MSAEPTTPQPQPAPHTSTAVVVSAVLSIFTFAGLVLSLVFSSNMSAGACTDTWLPTLKGELTSYGADDGRIPPVDGMATYLAGGDQDSYAHLAYAFLGNGAQALRVVDYQGELKTGQVLAYCVELSPIRRLLRLRAPAAYKLGEGIGVATSVELEGVKTAEPSRLLLPPKAEDMAKDGDGKPTKELQVFVQRVMARISEPCGETARQNADVAYQRATRNLLRNKPMAAYQGYRQACESCAACDCLRGVALARARDGAMADARAAMRGHEKCVGSGAKSDE